MSLPVFGSQDAVDRFLYACALGDVQSVSDRIRNGVYIDAEDGGGNTSLQIASAAGHISVVELLLRSGAAVAKSNFYGWSALHQAACAGHLRVSQTLVQHGCSFVAKTKYGQTALALAASNGHVKIVNFLLSLEAPSPQTSPDSSGLCTLGAILTACAFGKVDVLPGLINAEGNVNEKCGLTGTTGLMLAAAAGHVDCCQFLNESNADLGLVDCAGRSAAAYAAMLGHKVQLLMVTGRGDASSNLEPNYFEEDHVSVADVFDALRSDDMDLLSRVLSASPGLKGKETVDGNRTLLIEAASSRNTRALKLLIVSGCSVNATASNSGRTALSHAIESCFEDGVLLLLDAGADPTIKDLSGKSALDYMAHRLCKLSQLVIRRMCLAGLTELAPNLLPTVDGTLTGAMKGSPSVDDLKSGKTLFGRLRAKFSKSKSKQDLSSIAVSSPEEIFSFPCSGPLAFSIVNNSSNANTNTNAGGGLLELDPVRVESLTPPFDRRKLIWTDGAPDDSNASGPPLSSSLKDETTLTLPPGTSMFTKRPKNQKATFGVGQTSSRTNSQLPEVSQKHLAKVSTSSMVSASDDSADETELRSLLRNMQLDRYESLLKNNEINDLTTFQLLTERDLRDLKVTTNDRHSLIKAISKAQSISK